MTGYLLAILIPLTYVLGATMTCRARYQLKRPYTEPLSCDRGDEDKYHTHYERCYRRKNTMADTNAEAASFAIAESLAWPVVLLCAGLVALVTRKPKALPEEVQAKGRRLERELGIGGDGS